MYNSQMEMFQDGGLKDQGNTTDPVSGNDVPSGSLKEEVRDDIDAKLSPGEFVFPADVVRFIGLEKLMMIRDKAKKGLSRMEDMGQMGNSDEATIDDDVPFGMEDLIIVSGGPENEMSKGGVPSYSRGGQLIGDIGDGYQPPTRYHNPATGQELMVTKIAGKFFPPLPKGFVPKPTLAQANPTSGTRVGTTSVLADDQYDETTPGDPINTGINSDGTMTPQESAGGEQRGNAGTEKSFDEMTPTELANYGDWAKENPMKASIGQFMGNTAEYLSVNPMSPISTGASVVGGVASAVADRFGMVAQAPTFGPTPGSMYDITGVAPEVVDYNRTDRPKGAINVALGTKNLNKARAYSTLRTDRPETFAQMQRDANSTALGNAKDSVAGYSTATQTAALSMSFGATPAQVASHADAVGRGDRPQGSTATPDGYTTIGPNTTLGYSTVNNEINYQATVRDRELQDRKNKAKADFDKSPPAEAPDPDPVGPGAQSVGQMQTQDPAETGTQTDETSSMDQRGGLSEPGVDQFSGPDAPDPDAPDSETAAAEEGDFGGVEGSKGGFIPKRKKQKKMKRGGLASRK